MNLPRTSFPLFTRIIINSILIQLLLSGTLSAQLDARYLKQYTEQDGVPASVVYNILADRLGFIWVGTVNGLARFDGYEFKRYFNNPNDSNSIHGSIIWNIFEDHKGQIWVGAGPSYLNAYNPATRSFHQYDFAKLIDHPANIEIDVARIGEDKKGRLYLGINSYNGEEIGTGLLYIDETDNKIKKYIPDDNQELWNVYSMCVDNHDNIWLLSYSGILKIDSNRKFSRLGTLKTAIASRHEFPSEIKCDKNGHLWIITNSSNLWEYNPADSSYKTYTPPGKFDQNFITNSIALDKKETIWMGTNKGLLRFNTNTHQFDTFKTKSSTHLEQTPIRYLCLDSFGTLWAGTHEGGILKYEERPIFKSYSYNKDDKNSITTGWVNMLYETSDGNIWSCTSGPSFSGGLNELNHQTNTIRPFPYVNIANGLWIVNAIYETAPGEFIANTNGGTYHYSPKNNKSARLTLKGVPEPVSINQFYKDSHDNFWLCSSTGLYKRTLGTDTFTRYDLSLTGNGNASSNEITRALESKKHGLWLTTNNGLFLYNYNTDKIERHGFDKNAGDVFITQDINSIYETPDGHLWTGTWQGGLSDYNVETKKIKTYTRDDGLPSMSVQGIIADEKNNTLWLSTFEGLSRFDMKAAQFNNFSITDGIQSQLFADGASLKTSGGLFAFGGSNGFTIFNPADITRSSIPPKVLITDLKLFNKSIIPGDKSVLKAPVYDTKEIELEYSQNNISLEFIALHFSNPSKNKYAFKLENYDKEWHETTNQHEVSYSSLPPGNYLFRVKAANNNGVWNEQGATLSIIVKPPWWKTTLAYILYTLIFVALAFAIDRYFRRRIVTKERERNRARELEQAKEIEKAYHSLAQTHETLKATQSQLIQSEKMASLGELTAGIAHEIQNPLNFVNNFSEVNKELLVELTGEMSKGNIDEANAIVNDVIENSEKINHHGKRADAIVKGMLQHSQRNSGIKEPTDINALAEEYLRLSYHGLRAKDKSFNATIKTDFDEAIGKINIIPQDIGRVLLNLYNNAFYAVSEKAKLHSANYNPEVSLSTKKNGNIVEIKVKDNGNGIPQNIVDKIFQPFFTTKPTGQGTGLGLSLAYDIVKAHGGELKAESKESRPDDPVGRGDGTTFIIQLPQ